MAREKENHGRLSLKDFEAIKSGSRNTANGRTKTTPACGCPILRRRALTPDPTLKPCESG